MIAAPTDSPATPPLPERGLVTLCRSCGRPIDRMYPFCPYCGKRQQDGRAWYYDPVWIAILGLFVIGPFALPLVWRSTRMNRTLKLIYTALLVVYAAITIYYVYIVIGSTLRVFSDLGQVLEL